ncbi:alpha/beta hydrolase [Microbacterium sp. HD4P20]|uniref:alpha/beta fold hydrolase n=1 Tax=Microbacterium sp. HD4P20 TaxID=2864874 RepID=UPI0020A4A5CD|nr:alpha/beta fold hydrolase [Microbacterium sp. HD4P20]MCP2634974.1 alpha/beta hydrolase [Microbacterium sp. HD4P20]
MESGPSGAQSILFIHGGNVAGWMWRGQAEALPGFHSLIPDLPGFGVSADEPWPTLVEVADALADLVRAQGEGGRAHVVGLSLGGVLGVVLAARHPDVVRSVFVTGAAVRGIHGLTRAIGLAQLPMWGSRSYWVGLARAFRLPADSVDEFVTTGLGIDRESARRMMREVYDGVPAHVLDGLRGLGAPLLAIAGEREPRVVRAALHDIVGRAPQGTAAIAPRMHHVWSAEDPELFHRVLRHWLTRAEASPELSRA